MVPHLVRLSLSLQVSLARLGGPGGFSCSPWRPSLVCVPPPCASWFSGPPFFYFLCLLNQALVFLTFCLDSFLEREIWNQ